MSKSEGIDLALSHYLTYILAGTGLTHTICLTISFDTRSEAKYVL